jgi:hypothetical protein
MTRHRLFNIATAIVYTLAVVVVYFDVTVWRP